MKSKLTSSSYSLKSIIKAFIRLIHSNSIASAYTSVVSPFIFMTSQASYLKFNFKSIRDPTYSSTRRNAAFVSNFQKINFIALRWETSTT
ncbi:hypothetical protein ACT3CD_06110 [Geofilum sp. OHC36d9]|uniref:hypothetical protein n=1 Tax=Geofilum sp. OHC36d9 TaxID=3458413 RepID=UPI0040348B8C